MLSTEAWDASWCWCHSGSAAYCRAAIGRVQGDLIFIFPECQFKTDVWLPLYKNILVVIGEIKGPGSLIQNYSQYLLHAQLTEFVQMGNAFCKPESFHEKKLFHPFFLL